jgi:hypothetical protein
MTAESNEGYPTAVRKFITSHHDHEHPGISVVK